MSCMCCESRQCNGAQLAGVLERQGGWGGGVWEEEVVFTLHPFQQNMLLPWQLLRLNVMLD